MKKLTEPQDELLDKLFAGELGADDESTLLRNYADPHFKDELQFQLTLRKALRWEHAQSPLKKELRAIGQRQKARQYVKYAVLATFGLLLVALIAIPPVRNQIKALFSTSAAVSDELAVFIIMPSDPKQAGDQHNIDEANYQLGRNKFFVEKQYNSATAYLKKVSSSSPYYDPARILLAHAWLNQSENLPEAIDIFTYYIGQSQKLDSLRNEIVCDIVTLKWNRMLAYQLNGNTAKYCEELAGFMSLPDGDFYKNKAKALGQKIKC